MAISNSLKLSRDPFGREAPAPIVPPVQLAFDEVMREIGRGTTVIVVIGPAGSGKSLLLDITESACSSRGLSVGRIDRGDLAHTVLGEAPDLLLVDEADSVDPPTLQLMLSNRDDTGPRSIVFACRLSDTARYAGEAVPVFVKVAPLAPADARKFIIERVTGAGHAELFEPEALDRLVAATKGSPRLLQSIAGHALFCGLPERDADRSHACGGSSGCAVRYSNAAERGGQPT